MPGMNLRTPRTSTAHLPGGCIFPASRPRISRKSCRNCGGLWIARWDLGGVQSSSRSVPCGCDPQWHDHADRPPRQPECNRWQPGCNCDSGGGQRVAVGALLRSDGPGRSCGDAGRHPRKTCALPRPCAGRPWQARVAATFGLHASMTLSDETLEACSAESDRFHVHAAEHPGGRLEQPGPQRKTHGRKIAQLWHHRGRKYLCPLHTHRPPGRWPSSRRRGRSYRISPRSNMNNAGGRGQCPGDAAGRDGRRTRQ